MKKNTQNIDDAGTYPLPVSIVHGEIAVDQVAHKVSLASLPVDQKILDQEAGCNVADATVHISSRIQLTHTCHISVARVAKNAF
jgi:hypothetical protein